MVSVVPVVGRGFHLVDGRHPPVGLRRAGVRAAHVLSVIIAPLRFRVALLPRVSRHVIRWFVGVRGLRLNCEIWLLKFPMQMLIIQRHNSQLWYRLAALKEAVDSTDFEGNLRSLYPRVRVAESADLQSSGHLPDSFRPSSPSISDLK